MYESSTQSEAEAARVTPEWKLPTHFLPTLSSVIGLAAARISQQSYYRNTLQNRERDESIVCFITLLAIVSQKKVFCCCLLFYYEQSKVGVAWTWIIKKGENNIFRKENWGIGKKFLLKV